MLSQLLRYEQFEQFPISYVAALFKELRFQPGAAEVVEVAIRKHRRHRCSHRTLLGVGGGGGAYGLSFSEPCRSINNRPGASYVDATHEAREPGLVVTSRDFRGKKAIMRILV